MATVTLRSVRISRPTPSGFQVLLSDFDLTIASGEHVLLIGGNGVGKSSLLKVIAGTERPESGLIAIDRSRCGYVPQNYRETLLPWCSAEKNALSLARYRGASLKTARQRLSELSNSFELDFPLSRKAGVFSGGQQQLLCILRALVAEPTVLILDEACSALSGHKTNLFWSALAHHANHATWLVTSHQVEADMRRVDRVLEIGEEAKCKTVNF